MHAPYPRHRGLHDELLDAIRRYEREFPDGASRSRVVAVVYEQGADVTMRDVEDALDTLVARGDVYEPTAERLRLVGE